MRNSICLFVAFGLVLCAAPASLAQPGGKGPGGFGGFGKKKGPFEGEPGIAVSGLVQPKITRWEYRIESGPAIMSADSLNKLGSEGWELAGVESGADKSRSAKYIFRRPLTGEPKAVKPPKADPVAAPKEKTELQLEIRMYLLKNANANDAAALLMDVLRTNRTDPMRVAPDPRTNQIIVNASPRTHVEIDAILQRLDLPDLDTKAPAGKKQFPKSPFGGK